MILRDVLGFHALECPENAFEIGLRGNKDPGSAVADGAKGFRHGLEVEHQFGVLPNELPDLIDEEVQPKSWGLPCDVVFDHLREAFDRNAVVFADLPH